MKLVRVVLAILIVIAAGQRAFSSTWYEVEVREASEPTEWRNRGSYLYIPGETPGAESEARSAASRALQEANVIQVRIIKRTDAKVSPNEVANIESFDSTTKLGSQQLPESGVSSPKPDGTAKPGTRQPSESSIGDAKKNSSFEDSWREKKLLDADSILLNSRQKELLIQRGELELELLRITAREMKGEDVTALKAAYREKLMRYESAITEFRRDVNAYSKRLDEYRTRSEKLVIGEPSRIRIADPSLSRPLSDASEPESVVQKTEPTPEANPLPRVAGRYSKGGGYDGQNNLVLNADGSGTWDLRGQGKSRRSYEIRWELDREGLVAITRTKTTLAETYGAEFWEKNDFSGWRYRVSENGIVPVATNGQPYEGGFIPRAK